MTVFLADPDVTVHHGDALETLRGLPAGSVDCCITSPPYWGLRDYGTGSWEGGNPGCDHTRAPGGTGGDPKYGPNKGCAGGAPTPMGNTCGKCGARRVDRQLGLEPTPEEWTARLVAVFAEVRRVLADHGTCWVNVGDSYASNWPCSRRNIIGEGSLPNGKREARPPRIGPGLKEKDLVGAPWLLAFALRADGWYLRSEIIWAKPNPMPESVTDRPTKAHEQVFLLSKRPRYWYDAEAVREPHNDKAGPVERFGNTGAKGGNLGSESPDGLARGDFPIAPGGRVYNPAGRNVRSVWEIATQAYPEAHFATYPEELVRRCLLAGCPAEVCRECGRPRERIVERSVAIIRERNLGTGMPRRERSAQETGRQDGMTKPPPEVGSLTKTVGWTDCGHGAYRLGVVLDPFLGSGTTAHVARRHGRHAIGIELSAEYCRLAVDRLRARATVGGAAVAVPASQLSLLEPA